MRGTRLCWILILIAVFAAAQEARACHWCDCNTTASCNAGTLLMCPAGDGQTLAEIGSIIDVYVIDYGGYPVPAMPAADFWIVALNQGTLCGSWQSSNADGPTDENGHTTISGTVAGGGFWDTDVHVVASGYLVQGDVGCNNPLPLVLVSPDTNEDLIVDLVDFSMFGTAFTGGAYEARFDFNGDGLLDLLDLSLFGNHFGHVCTP